MSLFELPDESGLLNGSLEESPDKSVNASRSFHKKSVSTAAPLEQHIKIQQCDGIKYKVIKEDPTGNVLGAIKTAIKDSRVAELQKRQRE